MNAPLAKPLVADTKVRPFRLAEAAGPNRRVGVQPLPAPPRGGMVGALVELGAGLVIAGLFPPSARSIRRLARDLSRAGFPPSAAFDRGKCHDVRPGVYLLRVATDPRLPAAVRERAEAEHLRLYAGGLLACRREARIEGALRLMFGPGEVTASAAFYRACGCQAAPLAVHEKAVLPPLS